MRLPRSAASISLASLLVLLNLLAYCGASEPALDGEVDTHPSSSTSFDDFLILPLWVHLLEAPDAPDLHCRLTDADIERIIAKVNNIWHAAGIHFDLRPLKREPPANLDRYHALVKLAGVSAPLGRFRDIRPRASRDLEGLHVYYIHQFEVNGVYLGRDIAFVKDSASLREVVGGIDEPLPRVTAHELGHALGLPHRQNRTNLMASGTTGFRLNEQEIATVRSFAVRKPGASTAATLREISQHAAATGDHQEADRLSRLLRQVPGFAFP